MNKDFSSYNSLAKISLIVCPSKEGIVKKTSKSDSLMTHSLLIHTCLCGSRCFPPLEKLMSTIILTRLILGRDIKFAPNLDIHLYELHKI